MRWTCQDFGVFRLYSTYMLKPSTATRGEAPVDYEALVDDIVAELEKGGLNDPRGLERRPTLLPEHVRDVAHRTIARGKAEPVVAIPSPFPDPRKVARALGKQFRGRWLLRPSFIRALKAERVRLRRAWVEPGPRADTKKHWAASEAWDFMEIFSKEPPTSHFGSKGGPFYVIAQRFHEAVGGDRDGDMTNACRAVFHARRERLQGLWPKQIRRLSGRLRQD
jgi:hypothetical protein